MTAGELDEFYPGVILSLSKDDAGRVPEFRQNSFHTPNMNAHVYILRCRDGSYYVGSTSAALEDRVARHNAGLYPGYTKARRPVRLVYRQDFERIEDAIAAERRNKGWSRAKKEALMRADFEALRSLAKGRTGTERRHPSTGSGRLEGSVIYSTHASS